jgi:hypothetical protein
MRSNIGLKKISADSESAVLIRDDSSSTIKNYRPRVMRAATLDGGAIIENLGYSDGDRELNIISRVDEEIETKLRSMVQDELYLVISTRDGVFYGAINYMKIDRGNLNLKILAQERDDA